MTDDTSTTPATNVLIAYSWDTLTELWRLPGVGGLGMLAESGVLYTLNDSGTGYEMIAVQTPSPGLAKTAYPTDRGNNQRTGWQNIFPAADAGDAATDAEAAVDSGADIGDL